jgi:hypothetical protein
VAVTVVVGERQLHGFVVLFEEASGGGQECRVRGVDEISAREEPRAAQVVEELLAALFVFREEKVGDFGVDGRLRRRLGDEGLLEVKNALLAADGDAFRRDVAEQSFSRHRARDLEVDAVVDDGVAAGFAFEAEVRFEAALRALEEGAVFRND